MSFYTEILRYEFGERSANDLPQIAVRGLEEGLDTKNLRVLAACLDQNTSTSELLGIYSRAVAELDLVIPPRRDIAVLLIEELLGEIISEQIRPYEGAKQIVPNLLHVAERPDFEGTYIGESIGLQFLCGLRYSYDDIEEALDPVDSMCTKQQLLQEIETQIRVESERLLSEHPWRRESSGDEDGR